MDKAETETTTMSTSNTSQNDDILEAYQRALAITNALQPIIDDMDDEELEALMKLMDSVENPNANRTLN